MRTDDPTVITESAAEVARQARAVRGHRAQARVRLLRLLKDGTAPSLARCAPLVGYSLRQLNRWWADYKAHGLAGLLTEKPRLGKIPKLTPAAYAGLEEQMRAGQVAPL